MHPDRPPADHREHVFLFASYLKHAFNESDEALVERWGETPLWQPFSGMQYDEHRRACDPTALVKFRRMLGEAGVEELLAQTVNATVNLSAREHAHAGHP